MASRPVFSSINYEIGVKEKNIDFKWHPGLSTAQKQKSIDELHTAAKQFGINRVLEISSKSREDLGVRLSAFNLSTITKKHNQRFSVETAFQGAKVFENGGPYTDMIGTDSRAAKRDSRHLAPSLVSASLVKTSRSRPEPSSTTGCISKCCRKTQPMQNS